MSQKYLPIVPVESLQQEDFFTTNKVEDVQQDEVVIAPRPPQRRWVICYICGEPDCVCGHWEEA